MSEPGELSGGDLLALVTSQAALIQRQSKTIVELRARVAELERRLGLNSGNSSMPPSADDLPGRTPPPEKPAALAKRKRGKQPQRNRSSSSSSSSSSVFYGVNLQALCVLLRG